MDGYFILQAIPEGPYDVVASMIGYEASRVAISVNHDVLNRPVSFRLMPTTYELDTVDVSAKRPRLWRRQFDQFRDHFLGNSPFADQTEILNPYVLDFSSEDGQLVARATEPLLIENRALGFGIRFILSGFRLDMQRQRLQYSGDPFFDELEASDADEAARWDENRRQAYHGSRQHLLWAVIHDRVEEEGFRLRMDDRIDAPTSSEVANLDPVNLSDLIEPSGIPGVYRIAFPHYLHVTYESREGGIRSFFSRRQESARQVSWLRNLWPGRVHADGSLYPPTPLVVSGYLTKNRIADRLPRNVIHAFQREHVRPASTVQAVDSALAAGSPDHLRVLSASISYESALPQEWHFHPTESAELRPIIAAMEQENWSKAIKMLNALVEQDPVDVEARYYRAIVHREIAKFRTLTEFEHWREGIADFKFVLERDSSYRDVLYQYALYSRIHTEKTGLRQHNVSYADAIVLGHDQVRLRPDLPDFQFHLFTLYRRYLHHTPTKKALTWLQENASEFAELFTAEAHRRADRLEDADGVLETLMARDLKIPIQPVLLSRARVMYGMDRPEMGEELVSLAIERIERPSHAAFIFEDAKYLVNAQELETYRGLKTAAEFKSFFEALWEKRDPMPASGYNVRMAEHYRRLREAEKNYAYDGFRLWRNNPDKSGELTFPEAYALNKEFNDRGLVYIRLGEPTERIATVSGEVSGLKSSLGVAGRRSTFLPKDQSFRADWVPNESWRYAGLGMDLHFVVDEGAAGANWRLIPALTNFDMLRDRMMWGGVYVQMARAAETAPEFRMDNVAPPIDRDPTEYRDTGRDPAALESWAVMDVAQGRSTMSDSSREAVSRGLDMDRHTWPEDVEQLDLPYLFAAFRGEESRTDLRVYYALSQVGSRTSAWRDTHSVEVGIAVHDLNWEQVGKDRRIVPVPTRQDAGAAVIQAIHVSVPPDSYHVALHARPLETDRIGAYRFTTHIPDFSAPALAMSDLVPAFEIRPIGPADPMRMSDLHIVANPFRQFALSEPVYVYFELYYLTFGDDDQTHYSLEYTLVPLENRRRSRRPSLSIKFERTGVTTSPIEYAEIDVGSVDAGKYRLIINVADHVSRRSASAQIPIELY